MFRFFFSAIGQIILASIMIAMVAVLGGTILYFIWPIAIPGTLPGLVAAGTIAAKLTWLQAVCLTYVAAILFKSQSTSEKSK